ncbi:hypothetical protein BCR36DRAFT_395293 [Piromyces finnis]|uniref:PTHB1 N-terminal domain-containing protein n=1 Tax=Piromyces finnis TaxID=1754191 RepID=A0A1Y1VK61_9FUNG|nr:hypothetical protein BCR36DRAFT_395293 [Piromyces finnis]|eukprot:ORX57170.1 hypothetical protein BCR36DRAFT_395293 [Piromyces finnis]
MFRLNKFWQQPLPNDEDESSSQKVFKNNFYINGGMILAELIENGPLNIITGCFDGIIRIYCPHGREYVPHDLQLEKRLEQPILGLGFSDFINKNENILAILHPNEISYHSIIVIEGLDIHGVQFDIKKISSVSLPSKAISFFYENFFNSDKALLCVQLFNGNIIFINGEQIYFEKNLPNALLYYPIKYIPYNDTFLINTLSFQLMCLKFGTVIDEKQKQKSLKQSIIQNNLEPQVLWSCLIGESISNICISKKYEKNQDGPKLIALGTTSLFFISHKGELLSSIKFDSTPTNFYLYPVYKNDQLLRENLMVVTLSNHLLIYSSHKLVWTAKLEKKIVNIAVAKINDIPGMIITLDINGQVEICYLGTNIYTTPLQQIEVDKDYKEMENEMKDLTELIDKYSKNEYIQKKEHSLITIDTHIPSIINKSMSKAPSDSISPLYEVEFIIKSTANFSIHNIKLLLSPVEPIVAVKPCQIIDTISNGKITVPVMFYVKDHMPCNLDCQASVIYSLPNSDICPKEGVIPKYMNKNIVGFKYWNKMNATINGSTRRARYRISSNYIEAIYLLLLDMKNRIKQISKEKMTEELDIKYQESYEFDDYIPYFDDLINKNEKLIMLTDDINNKTLQYKVIQKKLLLHYKDKIPVSLIGLRSLLEKTYESIHSISGEIINLKKDIKISNYNFILISYMLLELWSMKDFALKHKENFDLLLQSFSPRLLLLSEESNDFYIETIINVINIILKKEKVKVTNNNKKGLFIESLKSLNNYMNEKAFLFNENENTN